MCVISDEHKWNCLISGCSESIHPSCILPEGQPTSYFAILGWHRHPKWGNCIIQGVYWPCIAGPSYKGCSTRIHRSQEILSLVDFHGDLGQSRIYEAKGEFLNKLVGKDEFFALSQARDINALQIADPSSKQDVCHIRTLYRSSSP